MSTPFDLLLIDDHPLLRRGLAELFEAGGEFRVVGSVSSGSEGIALARELSPALVILDLHMPGLDGLATLEWFKRDLPDVSVVVLTVFIAIREGQFTGEIAGFLLGLAFDLVSSDIIGTNALSKMLAGFIAGYFFNEQLSVQDSIGSFRFLGITALAALGHNIVYYFFYVQPTDLSFISFFLRSGIAASLYTTVIAALVMLVAARKQRW